MKRIITTIVFALLAAPALAATVSVEIASERGVQINAPQEWLQLLSEAGAANARLRAAQNGEAPAVDESAGRRGAVYHLVAVLTRGDRLLLPGGDRRGYGRRDRSALADYFDRLKTEGPDSLTAERGAFGLTRPQFEELFAQLGQPLGVSTEGRTARELIEIVRGRLETQLEFAPGVRLVGGESIGAELQTLTVGTALAIVLSNEGLAMKPRRPRGGATRLVVFPMPEPEPGARRRREKTPPEFWPIGYPADGPPRNTSPELMQTTRVVVEGFTLSDVVDALRPRLPLPLVWDRAALGREKIDPAAIEVSLNAERATYKRILERLLFQARLRGELRVDEAGAPFYWMGR